jgi:hypothetical protein
MQNVSENFTVIAQEIKENLNDLQKNMEIVRGYL